MSQVSVFISVLFLLLSSVTAPSETVTLDSLAEGWPRLLETAEGANFWVDIVQLDDGEERFRLRVEATMNPDKFVTSVHEESEGNLSLSTVISLQDGKMQEYRPLVDLNGQQWSNFSVEYDAPVSDGTENIVLRGERGGCPFGAFIRTMVGETSFAPGVFRRQFLNGELLPQEVVDGRLCYVIVSRRHLERDSETGEVVPGENRDHNVFWVEVETNLLVRWDGVQYNPQPDGTYVTSVRQRNFRVELNVAPREDLWALRR